LIITTQVEKQCTRALKLHYARHGFPELKSMKNFGTPTLRFGPPSLNALVPALGKWKDEWTR